MSGPNLASVTLSATALVSNSATATVTAHLSSLNSLAKTFQRIVSVVHLKNAKLVWALHAHVQVSGKSGDHVTACVDLDTVSESSQIRVLSTPTETQRHHKLKPNRAASRKCVSPANGQSGLHAMQSVTPSGKHNNLNIFSHSTVIYTTLDKLNVSGHATALKVLMPTMRNVAVMTQLNVSPARDHHALVLVSLKKVRTEN